MAMVTKTVVFTDLADYTKNTAKADSDSFRNMVKKHEEHTRAILEPYGGIIVKNLGDSFMVGFHSATEALKACIELVESRLVTDSGTLNLRFRASAATGDVEEIDGDYFGSAVNLSARINSKTPAGEVWFASNTRACMNPSDVPWESVGAFDFKGIPGQAEVFRAVCPSQCILPDILKKEFQSVQSNIYIVSPQDIPEITKTTDAHIIFKNFDLGDPELLGVLRTVASRFAPGNIWLLSTALPMAERLEWSSKGRGLIIGTESAFEESMLKAQAFRPISSGTNTVFMDFSSSGDLSLEIVGVAMLDMPWHGIIDGYTIDLMANGEWGFGTGQAILRADVQGEGVFVTTMSNQVSHNGRQIAPGQRVAVQDQDLFNTPAGAVRYTQLPHTFTGIFTGTSGQSTTLNIGDHVELGREPSYPGMTLPMRNCSNRIQWGMSPRAQQARSAGWSWDRVLMGRHQCQIRAEDSQSFELRTIHERLATYSYSRGRFQTVKSPIVCNIGDFIIVGMYVIEVSQVMG